MRRAGAWRPPVWTCGRTRGMRSPARGTAAPPASRARCCAPKRTPGSDPDAERSAQQEAGAEIVMLGEHERVLAGPVDGELDLARHQLLDSHAAHDRARAGARGAFRHARGDLRAAVGPETQSHRDRRAAFLRLLRQVTRRAAQLDEHVDVALAVAAVDAVQQRAADLRDGGPVGAEQYGAESRARSS